MVTDFIKSSCGTYAYLRPLKNAEEHTFKNGKKIFISTLQRKYHVDNAIQAGEVLYPPTKATDDGGEVEIRKGDIVYTHHFLTEPENCCLLWEEYGEVKFVRNYQDTMINPTGKTKIYSIEYEFIFAYLRDGKMTMLHDISFLTPIEVTGLKSEGGLILQQFTTRRTDVAILTHPSRNLVSMGYREGDKVLLKEIMKLPQEQRQCKIMVEGKLMFWCKDREIMARINYDA